MAGPITGRTVFIMSLIVLLGGCYYRQPSSHVESSTAVGGAPEPMLAGRAEVPSQAVRRSALDYIAYREPAPYAENLTLRDAVRRALRFSPAVRAAEIEIDAKRAEALQAGLRPNPELSGDVENVGESGQEATIALSQLFELGGKRLKRLRAAELEVGVAAWDFEAARIRVASDTAQAFLEVLASQNRIEILADLEAVTQRLAAAVRERVKAGGVSPIEEQRTQIEVTRARAQLDEERAFLDVAKRRLANFWGNQNAAFEHALGDLVSAHSVPTVEQIRVYLSSNPDIARWAEEMTRRNAVFALARANAVPDLTIGAGARNIKEDDETGAVVSLSIPLPLFNRNQGEIEAARTRISKGQTEALSAVVEVNNVLLEAYGRLVVSAKKLRALETEILPSAREIYEATSTGYSAGKFDLLNVLDAQRTLFSARLEIVNARAEFQKAKVQIEALIGRGLDAV